MVDTTCEREEPFVPRERQPPKVGKSILLTFAATAALTAPLAAQRFEAAAVKPCGDGTDDRRTGEILDGGGGGSASPNRMDLGCWTVKDLILSAYVRYANAHDHSLLALWSMPIEGGEDWINYDRFTIDAKAGGAPGQEEMRGPMMQALLVVEAQATSLNRLAWLLSLVPAGLGRPVIDRTGIVGLFDFLLAYSREGSAPASASQAPSVQAALQQVG